MKNNPKRQRIFLFFAFITIFIPYHAAYADNSSLTEIELKLLQTLSLSSLGPIPNSPSNQYADSPKAIAFGEKLFNDQRFSDNGQLSCASCHKSELAFTDGEKLGVGVHKTGRNTQTLIGLAWQRWFYWDGRRDSLWSQALVPFEAADEMGASRTHVLRVISQDPELKKDYENLFGILTFPSLDINAKHAGPWGDQTTQNAWHRLNQSTQETINREYANIGKAVAAFVRTIGTAPTRFDHFIDCRTKSKSCDKDNPAIASTDEIAGMKLFVHPTKTRCFQCHNGPWLSNGSFHNIGTQVDTRNEKPIPDFGRLFGIRGVKLDEFNCVGPYSDANPNDCTALRFLNQSGHVPLQGAFKVPTLRSLKQTGPYFHDGRFDSIEGVITHYQNPPPGQHELVGAELSPKEAKQLKAFLLMLSD